MTPDENGKTFDANKWLEDQRAAHAKEFGYPIDLHTEAKPDPLLAGCQALIKDAEEKRDEFLASRDRYANIAGQLAEYIRAEHGRPVPYPSEAMNQMDLAHGLIQYEWTSR